VGKSHSSGDPTARDRRFARLDEALRMSGNDVRSAVHALCVDHWGSDLASPWLGRLIESRRAMLGAASSKDLADEGDWARWASALDGLLAMAGGKKEQTRNKLLTRAHSTAK
jgi:hypothetical protein